MGYKIISPGTVTIGPRVRIGEGATIYPNNHLLGDTTVGAGAVLYPNNIVEDSEVGEGARLTASVVRGAKIGAGAEVGPFCTLRAGACVGENCRVGDFVEIKNASIGARTKIAHLAYIGDADVGEACNIGCGAVFCNYDGRKKSRTRMGSGCFVGSNVNLVAPLSLGDGCYIAAGTTVTRDVPAGAFVIGRVRQAERGMPASLSEGGNG